MNMTFLTFGGKPHVITRSRGEQTKSRGIRHINMACLTWGGPHVIMRSRGEQTKSRGTQNWSRLVFSGRNPIRKYPIQNC